MLKPLKNKPKRGYYANIDGKWYRMNNDPDDYNRAIMLSSNSCSFYHNNQLHRDGGPSHVSEKSQYYVNNGHFHREDGPAVIIRIGNIYVEEYWINGKKLCSNRDVCAGSRCLYHGKYGKR